MKRTLTIAAMLALSAAAFMPLPALALTDMRISINAAPPTPRFESVPAPRAGHVWVPGYWNWEGNRHVWSNGHWERARNGYEYQRSEWVRDDNNYVLQRGGWQEVTERDYDVIRIAPPTPRHERIPRARRGYIWEPGHWEWNGRRYEWERGQWLRDRPGQRYHTSSWIERNGHWTMEPSRWSRGREYGRDRDRGRDGIPDRMEHRDTDRDGVADAYDSDWDNDGVPNRRDVDRDGDGVRNDRDYRPNNPRRD